MFLYWFTMILTLRSVVSRDALKPIGPPPIITNSLVNLGKMDISIHFDTKAIPPSRTEPAAYSSSIFFKPELVTAEPCPCGSPKNFKQPLIGSPSDIFNKIRSDDLFSFNKDSITSSMCCESHEGREEIVTFELNPKSTSGNGQQSIFPFSHLLNYNIPQKTYSVPSTPLKSKAVEIFLFPKKKGVGKEKFPVKKDSIDMVADKELTNNIISFKSEPYVLPITSTAKKDLTKKENSRSEGKENKKVTTTTTFSNPNIL